MTLGKRISRLRSERKISQEYLAEYMNVSRQAVSKWEHDLSAPDMNNLIRLASYFEVSVEYLATGKESQTISAFDGENRMPILFGRLSQLFFFIAFLSHCIGFFSGEFTKPLIPVFPYLWYGDSIWAVVLNVFTVLFTIGWIALLIAARFIDKTKGANKSA